jgi:hypothetical protein
LISFQLFRARPRSGYLIGGEDAISMIAKGTGSPFGGVQKPRPFMQCSDSTRRVNMALNG